MAGSRILILDKEEGLTSFSSLNSVKKAYKPLKVGHTGTLDKFASGLMVVLTGAATKLAPVFSGMDKSYRATIRFGAETDTLDPEGEIIANAPLPDEESLKAAIKSFTGSIMQRPPVYSAIHVDGKRAYQEARRGKEVEMPLRNVFIHSIKLESFTKDEAVIIAHVSKGTYIRSLARDIAIEAGSRGYLTALDRLTVGPYTRKDVTGLECLEETSEELLSRVVPNFAKLDPLALKPFSNGQLKDSFLDRVLPCGYFRIYSDNKLIAVGERREDGLHTTAFLAR